MALSMRFGEEDCNQSRVAGGHCGCQVLGEPNAFLGCLVATRREFGVDNVGEVEADPAGGAPLAGGKGEQCLDEPLLKF